MTPPAETVTAAMRGALEAGDPVRAVQIYAAYARQSSLRGENPRGESVTLFRSAIRTSERGTERPLPSTPFFGRHDMLAQIAHVLADDGAYAVLHGPGGVGKTRLALQIAELHRKRYDDVRWCEIEGDDAGGTAALIDAAVADVPLGARVLIVIDEVERQAAAVREAIARLRNAAPLWSFLVTTRLAEVPSDATIVRIEPVVLPDADADPREVASAPAVAFFLKCARAVGARLDVAADNAADIARLCIRLDGLALGIEIVAAQMRVLSVHDALLRIGTHGALDRASERAVMESVAALNEGERDIFIALGVFPTHFTLADAEALTESLALCQPLPARSPRTYPRTYNERRPCATDVSSSDQPQSQRNRFDEVEPPAFVEIVARLVDWSLLQTENIGGITVYRYLSVTRDVARARLQETGSRAALEAGLVRVMLSCINDLAPRIGSGDPRAWAEIDVRLPTIRHVVGRLSVVDPQGITHALCALRRYWSERGYAREALNLIDALPLPENGRLEAELRLTQATCWRVIPDFARADTAIMRALELAERGDDATLIASVLSVMGTIAYKLGDYGRSQACLERLISMRDPDDIASARAQVNLAVLHASFGNYEAAFGLYDRLEARFDDPHLQMTIAVGRAYCYAATGNEAAARICIERANAALDVHATPYDSVFVAYGECIAAMLCADVAGTLAAARKALSHLLVSDLRTFAPLLAEAVALATAQTCEPPAVARIYGFAEERRRTTGALRERALDLPAAAARTTLRKRLGENHYRQELAAGAATTLEAIAQTIFALIPQPTETGKHAAQTRVRIASGVVVHDGRSETLAPRERALIVALIAAGRPVEREALLEALWPQRDEADAANALRVTLHRLRSRLGDQSAVRRVGNAFTLDAFVNVDLLEVERALRRHLDDDEAALVGFLDDVRQAANPAQAEHPWSDVLERRIDHAARGAAARLAGAALASGRTAQALDLAAWLVDCDPLDEEAVMLAVRAWQAAGETAAARRCFEAYVERLKIELDAEPGAALRALVS